MKYLYTTILLCIFIFDLSAQARMSSGRLSVGSLTAASETLEVFGDSQITGLNPFLRFKLSTATPGAGEESGLHWRNATDQTDMRMLYSWLDDRLYFLPDTDQNFAHLSIENSTGNVGINVRDPLEQLHVNGRMFITQDIRLDGPEYIQFEESGTRKAYLYYSGTHLFLENNETNGDIYIDGENEVRLNTDDISRMYIKKDGKVGIGTSLPSELLDVDGNITIPPNSRYGFDESGVNKAAIAYNGTNMFIENDETNGAITIDGESFVSINSNDIERMRVANNGNVGIGETSPAEKLHIAGGIRIGASTGNGAGTIRYTGSDFEGRVGSSWVSMTAGGGNGSLWTPSGGNAYFNSGNVGIGTTSPAHTLQVNGDIGMTGEILGVSDIRTKKDIKEIKNASAIIQKLRPVNYEFSNENFEDLDLPIGQQFGFIAQELEDVLPELVAHSATAKMDGVKTELKGINYIQMIPVLTQALQEQQSLIDKQQSQIEELKTLVKDLVKK
jgi:hypothetical protein